MNFQEISIRTFGFLDAELHLERANADQLVLLLLLLLMLMVIYFV